MKLGKFNMVIGGQAGSEAKGKLSGWLCSLYSPSLLVMTASPNAGHTVVGDDGDKWVTYHLPVGMVMCNAKVVLTPASLINIGILGEEIKRLGVELGEVTVDPRASIITADHLEAEKERKLSDIGSTLQGIGECRIGKMRRGNHGFASDYERELRHMGVRVGYTNDIIHTHLQGNGYVFCETTQGFDLDLEHGIDSRYCTSKMINPSMAMAEAGVPPQLVGTVYGVFRPYPIRVNNRTGTSGPYAEAEEITWEEVALRCGYSGDPKGFGEYTTTTKLPRRVFEFSWNRMRAFLRICQPDSLCLQFANYIDARAYGVTRAEEMPAKVWDFLDLFYHSTGRRINLIGTGPRNGQMVEVLR